ncbi:MAG TPA: sulfite exporter TauE/SafE family protein, partial [Candidatus Limnocylindrales bacterium]
GGRDAHMTLGADVGIFAVSLLAGVIGALAGVGGGILVIPALTILFGVDIRLAIGASIVSVIATSSGAAAAYVKDRITDMRVGMFLELATTTGAVAGALLAAVVAPALLYVLLGLVLLFSAVQQVMRLGEELPTEMRVSPAAERLRLVGAYPDPQLGVDVAYAAQRVPLGFAMMAGAGLVSGLLGIGSGALKVLAMDGAMRLPMKVSSATSNFMIGVTAAASAGIYLGRGDVDPTIAVPVALGVLAGATLGARILPRLSNRSVRLVFLPVLVAVGVETLLRGLGVGI